MGNTSSTSDLFGILQAIRDEMNSFQTRLAGLERDVANFGVVLGKVQKKSSDNSNSLLNISLLEEGRSTYKRKHHTASTYK